MIKAFLFDMDGTVFDTERIYLRGWHLAASELGYEMPDELIEKMRGTAISLGKSIFDRYFQGRHDYMEVRSLRKEYSERIIDREGLRLKPGARELISLLRDLSIKTGLATSTYREVVDRYLVMSHMEGMFDCIVTGDMAEKSKPDPEIFLKGMELLGTSPHETAICEDSLNGIMAAKASGARSFYIKDITHIPEESLRLYADCCFENLFEVRDQLIKGLTDQHIQKA